MRETCLLCVSKHISQAIVLLVEARCGYYRHLWYAVGHLAEAEAESCHGYPDLAEGIRNARLSLMGQGGIFYPASLDALLKCARDEAAKVNELSEEERVRLILSGEFFTTDGRRIEKTP